MKDSIQRSLCDFDGVKVSVKNDSNHLLILQTENQCLRDKVQELSNEVREVSTDVIDLANKIANIEGAFNELKENNKSNFSEHTSSHQMFIQQQTDIFEGTTALYEGWTWGVGILIALSAIISFIFIGKYRKREIQQVVDSVHADIKVKIDDDDIIINAVVNSFGNDEVKVQINTIKLDIERNILGRVNLQFNAIREDMGVTDNSSELADIIMENDNNEHE
jgi:hypothetical protein